MLLPCQGECLHVVVTQGVALGYELYALYLSLRPVTVGSGRRVYIECYPCFFERLWSLRSDEHKRWRYRYCLPDSRYALFL